MGEKEYSNKFLKDVSKFFDWADTVDLYLYLDSELKKWSNKLLLNSQFNEPSRNKLELFISYLINNGYKLVLENNTIKDSKLLVKKFNNDISKKVEYDPYPVVKEDKSVEKLLLLETLTYKKKELIIIFGEPYILKEVPKKIPYNTRWRIYFMGYVYYIHNNLKDKNLEDIWYLSGNSKKKKIVNEIIEYIQSQIKQESDESDIEESIYDSDSSDEEIYEIEDTDKDFIFFKDIKLKLPEIVNF